MTPLHYIDNEVGGWGEYDATFNAAQMSQTAEAAWPERGSVGARFTIASGTAKPYLRKDLAAAQPSLSLGVWFRVTNLEWSAGNYFYVIRARNAAKDGIRAYVLNSGGEPVLYVGVFRNAGSAWLTDTLALVEGRWYYLALDCSWSAGNATAGIYLDGALRATKTATGDATQCYPEYVDLGPNYASAAMNAALDADELKIADGGYPEPYVPAPADEYLSAARTAVLFRQALADSRELADYCVGALGIPRGLLIPLPNASADECLADYAAFQAQVETDLAAWLALNPTAAGQIACFLIGYGVPGGFAHAGVAHSAASRLMHYGTAFASQTDNPLYLGGTGLPPVRLTASALAAAGIHLAMRIDGDELESANGVIDAGVRVAGLSELADADTLYCDDAAYRASLGCQRLRIETAPLGTCEKDAFVWGDTGVPSWGPGGSRAAFANDSASAADTLRADTSACGMALIGGGYAAALGASEAPDGFDAASFFEMLRIGGSMAEAMAVAVEHVDYTAVPAGSPLTTVDFQEEGYNVYRGVGGADLDGPVACLRKDDTAPTLAGLGHDPQTDYVYLVRPVRGAGELETPDLSCSAGLATDAAGDWIGNRPGAAEIVAADVQASGQIELRWRYATPYGRTPPSDFGVYYAGAPRIAPGSPQATADYDGDGTYTRLLALTGGQTYYFAVTARSAGGAESPLSAVLGPRVADADAPPAPDAYVSASA